MNTNQLKYFVSVAEYSSFTKAADAHYISQAAITQQIQALEETVGTRLIDRDSRPITLTLAGALFLKEAKDILRRIESAVERTNDVAEGISGTFRIGYTKGYECSDLPLRIRDFHRKYPDVFVTCYRHKTDILAEGLLNGDFDLIYTWDSTNLRHEEQIEYRVVMEAQLLVALYQGHPLAQLPILSREDLKDENILFMTPAGTGDSFGDVYYISLYQKAGYNPNILLNTSDVESVLMMVAAEEGISILPAHCIDKLPYVDNLVFLPLSGEDEVEEILAAWRKDQTSPVLQRYLEML